MSAAQSNHLFSYLEKQQELACHLLAIMKGLEVLDNDGEAPDAITTLIQVGKKMADDLYIGLDRASIPEA